MGRRCPAAPDSDAEATVTLDGAAGSLAPPRTPTHMLGYMDGPGALQCAVIGSWAYLTVACCTCGGLQLSI